jgi:hypothetical protein
VRRKLWRARKSSGAGWLRSRRGTAARWQIGIADQRQAHPVVGVDERRVALPRGVEPGPALAGGGGGAVELGGADPKPRHHRLAMRRGQAGDVLRHPQPLHLDPAALADDVVVDAGAAGLREKRAQARVPRGGGSKGRRRPGRGARHADPAVAPVLAGNPFERVVTVMRVVGVDPVFAFGAVAAAAILIDGGIAMRRDRLPAAQDRTAHRFGGVRQPGAGVVEFMRCGGGGDAIGRAVQDHRPARAALRRQKDKRVEPGAVAHRHHRLKRASAHSPHPPMDALPCAGDYASALTQRTTIA